MSIKYQIESTKKNKNLINDEIKSSKIKSKGGHSDGRKPRSKNKMTLDKPARIVADRFAKQAKFDIQIKKQVSDLRVILIE